MADGYEEEDYGGGSLIIRNWPKDRKPQYYAAGIESGSVMPQVDQRMIP